MQNRRPDSPDKVTSESRGADEKLLKEIESAIRSIRFGTVQLILQDGRVVQIEKTEKIRLV